MMFLIMRAWLQAWGPWAAWQQAPAGPIWIAVKGEEAEVEEGLCVAATAPLSPRARQEAAEAQEVGAEALAPRRRPTLQTTTASTLWIQDSGPRTLCGTRSLFLRGEVRVDCTDVP